jgi:spore maturation protein B
MSKYGVDSEIGIIASVIMGATETTLYTITVYSNYVKIKKTRFVLASALIADTVGITVAIVICRLMSMKSC